MAKRGAGLPNLKEVGADERPALFMQKLEICSVTYPFDAAAMADTQLMAKRELKRQALLEIIDYINTKNVLTDDKISIACVTMLKRNLFRALPPGQHEINPTYDAEEDEPVLELAWPHLQLVYEFFLRFVVSKDINAKVAKKWIDKNFLVKLLMLFDSEDPRERDYLKTILHRIYGKFMSHRPFIRRSINNVFFHAVYENGYHNGISELLEILGSIINGFAQPLKKEHKDFLIRALVPLHKVGNLHTFHSQLEYCVTQFVEKDRTLSVPVIEGLLRLWPVQNSSKQVLLIGEVEEILELAEAEQFTELVVPLFDRISRCITSPHFQVSERALFLWNNEYVMTHVSEQKEDIFPIVFGALQTNTGHWNATVNGLTTQVLKLLMDLDPALYDKCNADFVQEQETLAERTAAKKSAWEELEHGAQEVEI